MRAHTFTLIRDLIAKIPEILSQFRAADKTATAGLTGLITDIQMLSTQAPDACIAAIHLIKDTSPLKQPIFSALIAQQFAQRLNYPTQLIQSLISAVLTSNISLIDYQALLNRADKPLSSFQLNSIRQHPLESVRILEAAGVTDPNWLTMIRQHHEQLDGLGYPCQLQGDAISEGAQILSLIEHYTAMIDVRGYRAERLPKQVLQDLYQQKNIRSGKLMSQFIQLMGVYPPGSYVILNNQEIGIVHGRQDKDVVPTVKALIDPQGQAYLGALDRDCHLPNNKIIGACAKPAASRIEMELLWG